MEIIKISQAEFNAKSRQKGSYAFNPNFTQEVVKAVVEYKGSCVKICSLTEAFANYNGKSNAKPSKIVATYFISVLAKQGYADATKGRVSINDNCVNLRL